MFCGNVAAILRPWGWKPQTIVGHSSKEERSNLFLWWLPEVATFALCFLPPELFLHKKLNFFKVIVCQILYNSLWMYPWMIQLCMLLYITLHIPNMSYLYIWMKLSWKLKIINRNLLIQHFKPLVDGMNFSTLHLLKKIHTVFWLSWLSMLTDIPRNDFTQVEMIC